MEHMNQFAQIINNINEFTQHFTNINDSNIDFIIKFTFNNDLIFEYEFQKLMIYNPNFSYQIIKLLDDRINNFVYEGYDYESIIIELEKNIFDSIVNNDDILTSKNIYDKAVKFIINNKWIYTYLNDYVCNVNDDDINTYDNNINPNEFKFRINQIEALDHLAKNGLITGIHCQATGCGKSIIMLKYCDYFSKNNYRKNIIIFTERINILSDLFEFKKENKTDKWKLLNIINLDDFEIINRVTIKKDDWIENLSKIDNKPKILVINRSYLTLKNKYKKITHDSLGLILHDECHNTSANQCYEFLKYCKKINIPIIGFSATPLRTGKTNNELNIDRLLDIYENDNKLNIITNYNMIYSISNNLILPPKFYWYQFETEKPITSEFRFNSKKVNEIDWAVAAKILNDVLLQLSNKKIIAWCGTIKLAEEWKDIFEKKKNDNVWCKTYPFLEDFNFYIDHSLNSSDYDKFKNSDGNCILFCAHKHREGSDIQKLDCCIFLDMVVNRGSIPFIQSIGRVLRIDNYNPDKKYGIIIDGLPKDNINYDKQIIDKIIGYYLALNNLTLLDNDKINNYNIIKNNIKLDKENKIINLKFLDNNITIDCKCLEWNKIIKNFDFLLEKKMNISKDDMFKNIISKIKPLSQFQNLDNDFWNEYEKLDHESLNIPKDIKSEYKEYFDKYTWYDLLDFGKIYSKYDIFKKYCIKNNIDSYLIYLQYQNKKFPKYPEEYYRLSGWNNWNFNYDINSLDL